MSKTCCTWTTQVGSFRYIGPLITMLLWLALGTCERGGVPGCEERAVHGQCGWVLLLIGCWSSLST